MARRDPKSLVPDFHLWTAVSRSIDPLGRRRGLRLPAEPLPLPPGPAALPPRLVRPQPPSAAPLRPKPPVDRGLEPRLTRRLRRGQIEIDATIDLHGMRQDEARAALLCFLPARAARGDRTVLVVTGKGLPRADADGGTAIERGVLRAMLPVWLSEPGLAPLVSGWQSAAQAHGGEGAFYVRLRRAA